MLKLLSTDGRRTLPARFPVGHLREQTRKLISWQDKPDRRLYAIATLAVLRDRLRSSDVWVEGSRSYRPMDEFLMPMPAFRTLKEDGNLGLGVQTDGAAYLSEAAQFLDFNLESSSPIVPETANLTASALNTASCSSHLSQAKYPQRPRN